MNKDFNMAEARALMDKMAMEDPEGFIRAVAGEKPKSDCVSSKWQSVEVRPASFGICALRIQTEFTRPDGELQVAHEILIGHSFEDKFSFPAGHDWHLLDRYFVTHHLELPPIDGLDRYFREVSK